MALDYPVDIKRRDLVRTAGGRAIIARFEKQASAFEQIIATAFLGGAIFAQIEHESDPSSSEPYWMNGWYPALDALALYAILAWRKPDRYVEVGSGNSTKFARKFINGLGLHTRIISIDPHPRADVETICDQCIRQPFESLDWRRFDDITPRDVLFIDSSHRSFQNSDVTVFFLEVLPALLPGTIYGLHDIFLPEDYPSEFLARFYNEQFLLAAYLLGGTADNVLFASSFVAAAPLFGSALSRLAALAGVERSALTGGAFWAMKVSELQNNA